MARNVHFLLILLLLSLTIVFNADFSRTGMPMSEIEGSDVAGSKPASKTRMPAVANVAWVAKEYDIVNTRAAGRAVAVYGNNIAFFVVENGTGHNVL